ncbi:MAG: YaiI/YqxD family protein [Acidobacteriota bacterium]
MHNRRHGWEEPPSVKKEVYRVAGRRGLNVILVSNSPIQAPAEDWIRCVVVGAGLDVADDWIAAHVGPDDIAVTADIPLADRCLKAGARVLTPTGKVFTDDSIGSAMANRDLLAYLRESGVVTGGPPPFSNRHRSQFLHELDQMIKDITGQA